jgi:hypothetical protein
MSDKNQCSVPIVHDQTGEHACQTETGGSMTVKPPEYVLIVTNPQPPVTTN